MSIPALHHLQPTRRRRARALSAEDRLQRRGRWQTVHRWLGIGLGAWFVLVGLTGALLVYRDTLDAWLNPGLLHARVGGPALDAAAIVELALELPELGRVERVRLPAGERDVFRLQVRPLASRVDAGRIEALFDPASGKLLGTRSLDAIGLARPELLRTLYEFHRNVLLGNWGSNIVGSAGVLLLGSVLTGIVIAWPRRLRAWRRLMWINARANATRIAFDLHRSGGTLIAALLLLSTLTGATLVWLNYVRDLVGVFSRVESFPTLPWRTAPDGEPVALGALLTQLQARFPAHRMTEIHIPPRGNTGYLVYLRGAGDVHRLGDTIAWVHPITGELLVERSARTRSSGEAFMHWLFPLHSGTAFGTFGLVAMCLTGLMPLLLLASGLWVWQRKRRGRRIGLERRSARQTG